MEVKIGIVDSPRELVLTSNLSQDEVESLVSDAVRGQKGLLTLVDDKGRRFIVSAARVAYVEIGTADARRVGFSVMD